MIIKMKRQEFDLLGHEALCNSCFKPLILEYKKRMAEQPENNPSSKELFYEELTKGQKALFMFKVFDDHSSESMAEFYWWSAYFMAQPKIWSALKTGLQYFKDDAMLLLLEEMEMVLKKFHHSVSLEGFTVVREDLDRNNELLTSIRPLHVIYEKTAPLTIQLISENIRNNQREFVQIED